LSRNKPDHPSPKGPRDIGAKISPPRRRPATRRHLWVYASDIESVSCLGRPSGAAARGRMAEDAAGTALYSPTSQIALRSFRVKPSARRMAPIAESGCARRLRDGGLCSTEGNQRLPALFHGAGRAARIDSGQVRQLVILQCWPKGWTLPRCRPCVRVLRDELARQQSWTARPRCASWRGWPRPIRLACFVADAAAPAVSTEFRLNGLVLSTTPIPGRRRRIPRPAGQLCRRGGVGATAGVASRAGGGRAS